MPSLCPALRYSKESLLLRALCWLFPLALPVCELLDVEFYIEVVPSGYVSATISFLAATVP